MVWAGGAMVDLVTLDKLLELMARKLGTVVRYQYIWYYVVGKLGLAVVNHLFGHWMCKKIKFDKP